MAKLKIRGKDLIKLGYPEGRAIGMAVNMMLKHFKRSSLKDVLEILKKILEHPDLYLDDDVLGRIAAELIEKPESENQEIPLSDESITYKIYGAQGIEPGASKQMDTAMRLPVTRKGALMPDAHQGYGLPIGGVLATENAIIPYGVGMDIGCRMALTIYDLSPGFLKRERHQLKTILKDNTKFGFNSFDKPMDDAIFERKEFKEIPFVSGLKSKAFSQIGSSGSGNHFVEFGVVEITDAENEFGLPVGEYVGILSHSGSRGFGANIARHYTKLAMEKCLLPKEAKNLAWLDLDTEAGQEYWLAMNLAGDYASACHDHIHHRLSKALGENHIAKIENHHNFAWKEKLEDGRDVVVHRKGATPAGKGVLGIIPGSMTAPGFIVRGKGNITSLNSASHGAGRLMSRTKAKNSITASELKKILKNEGVDLIGGGLDEAPIAYKNIHEVMKAQNDLVDVLGKFFPKIVRMAK
ncbi:MAG: RtcB family protein [Bacteroidetes bacterium]|jgi:tRNA-splicing ligase RtcB|nr:RtcB family protein [Bacteroidota bacterium]MDF1864924.1 RtcB family protein [Saprospiraceae bacterium]